MLVKKVTWISFIVAALFANTIFPQTHQNWSYNLNVYEVNTRQYTHSGTFNAFRTHLERLKNMGVGIIWFMPVHPIGLQHRLGSLGSPYSVKNYLDVNPEFGTLDDFKALVDSIHSKGMYVIIDWVGNHTSWDNTLTTTHPDWYVKDASGNFTPPPGTNWTDVIQLDYSKQALRDYMISAMSFWVTDVGVDGFRCDAVSFMPGNFWTSAISALKNLKPDIFMLAEDDATKYQTYGFDMTYAWGMYGFGNGVLKRITNGANDASDLNNYINSELSNYPNHNRMYFTSNHDENSWYGTVTELFGNAAESFAVLTAAVNSMQLVYGGQEAGLNKRLAFFDKDEITWQQSPYSSIYSTLWNLKKINHALWNGASGGHLQHINIPNNQKIYSFIRKKEDDKIFALFNLSPGFNGASITDTLITGTYVDIFTNDTVTFTQSASFTLPGWSYHIYKQINPSVNIQEETKPSSGFYLYQNYPNPFNPVTTINYTIAKEGEVKIIVYDALGRVVTSIVNEYKPEGNYTVQFNAGNLASGIYLYRLESGSFTAAKKLIIMK